jgi:tetratricopeptide (TPR) repeat protein
MALPPGNRSNIDVALHLQPFFVPCSCSSPYLGAFAPLREPTGRASNGAARKFDTLRAMNPEAIEKMIDQGRDSYEARLAAGQARRKRGDLERAIAHLEAATEHQPQQTMAWQELGRACQESGDLDAARVAWEKGLKAARSNGDKQAEKVMQVFLGRLDKAR